MSSQDQNLLSSLQQQVGSDRYLPPKVLEDTPNETAEYEKEVLQGAGGLLAGSSVEKGFKMLVKTPKGVKVLKKLGMTDEDVSTVVEAIKSRDSGALTDFLARKGTGFVESTAKKLGVKGGKIANTTVKNLKQGKLPTRQEIQEALTGGDKTTVNPSKSNLTNKPEDAGAEDDSSSSLIDALRSKAKSSIKSVKSSLDDAIGDSSSKVSNLISKADDLKSKGFGKVSKTFDRARAEIQGEDDFEGQSSAVKKLLQSSSRGRKQLLRNAKAKLKGEKIQKPKKPTSEFDDEDEQGDLFSQLSKLGGKPTADSPLGDLNPFTGQPVDPFAKIKASKQKADDELNQVKDQIENEGDRDPYQDIYDQASRDSQKFTDSELGVGKKLEKDVDFKFKAPTKEEHLQQLAEQETKTSNISDDMVDLLKDNEVKPIIPASEQTGGIDPSTLPDDAGFQRGSSKIQAKKEIDPAPEQEAPEPIEPTVPEPPKPEIDDTEELIQKTKIPDAPKPPVEDTIEPPTIEPPVPEPPVPKPTVPENLNPVQKVEELTQDDNLLRTTPAPPKPPVNDPKPPVNDPKPTIPDDPKPPVDDDDLVDNIASKGEKVEDGIKSAFEDSLVDDENPLGIVASAVLGIGALIGGALRKAHHPKFIQPPPISPYENFSVQEGVA